MVTNAGVSSGVGDASINHRSRLPTPRATPNYTPTDPCLPATAASVQSPTFASSSASTAFSPATSISSLSLGTPFNLAFQAPSAQSLPSMANFTGPFPQQSAADPVAAFLGVQFNPQAQIPPALQAQLAPQFQQSPDVLQMFFQMQALFGTQQTFPSLTPQQNVYFFNALRELMSFNLNDPLHVEVLMSIERNGANNPAVMSLLEAIRRTLPAVVSTGAIETRGAQPALEAPPTLETRPSSLRALRRVSSASGAAGPSSRKIFVGRNGKPVTIFVHFELRNRSEIVGTIKKHGGLISSDASSATYSVLDPRGASFKDYRELAREGGHPVVSDAFIFDSVADEELLDPRDYVPSLSSNKLSKTKRATSDSFFSKQRPMSEVKAEESEKTYSDAEMDIAWQEISRILEEDPDVTLWRLGRLLNAHPKLSSHTHHAWYAKLSKTESQTIDRMRSEARYAARRARKSAARAKAAVEQSPSPESSTESSPESNDQVGEAGKQDDGQEERGEHGDAEYMKVERPVEQSHSSSEDDSMPTAPPGIMGDARDDFEVAVRYLLETEFGEDEDEASLWVDFAQKAPPCKSASSWDEFAAEHHDIIISEAIRRANG